MPSSTWGAGSPVTDSAILVDVAAAKAEVPINHSNGALKQQVIQAGFFRGLAQRRFCRRLSVFQMSLGKTPVVVRVFDQQKLGTGIGPSAVDDPPGAHLQLGASFPHQKTETLK
jgi:hypothetical protein